MISNNVDIFSLHEVFTQVLEGSLQSAVRLYVCLAQGERSVKY